MIRILAAGTVMLLGEGAALACSCFMRVSEHTAREIVTEAAIVAEFEVVEEADYEKRRGVLLRPTRTYVGKPQQTYRLRFDEGDLCGSSFGPGKIAVVYRADVKRRDQSGMPLKPDLAHKLGDAAKGPGSSRRLAEIRAAVAERRLDAKAARYEDSGICLQLALADRGALDLVRREAARAGRRVPR